MKTKIIMAILVLAGYMVSAQSGNVGVGTSSPQAKLHVQGDLRVDSVPEQTNSTMNLAIDNTTGKIVKQQGTTKASGFVNSGVPVTLGNISAQMATSGNRCLMIRMANTATLSGTSLNNFIGSTPPSGGALTSRSGNTRQSDVFSGGSFWRWESGADFPQYGSTQQILLMDETNGDAYRILMIVGSGYNSNFISIEKL